MLSTWLSALLHLCMYINSLPTEWHLNQASSGSPLPRLQLRLPEVARTFLCISQIPLWWTSCTCSWLLWKSDMMMPLCKSSMQLLYGFSGLQHFLDIGVDHGAQHWCVCDRLRDRIESVLNTDRTVRLVVQLEAALHDSRFEASLFLDCTVGQ